MVAAELTFKDESDHLVVVMTNAHKTLLSYRQSCIFNEEAAGVLIGERRGKHLVIKEVSEPGNGDVRSRFAVDRLGPHHQLAVNEAHRRSAGTLQYLGEWHTHPEDYPTPSHRDLNSWGKHLLAPEPMVVIIVGREKVWAAKKVGKNICPLIEVK